MDWPPQCGTRRIRPVQRHRRRGVVSPSLCIFPDTWLRAKKNQTHVRHSEVRKRLASVAWNEPTEAGRKSPAGKVARTVEAEAQRSDRQILEQGRHQRPRRMLAFYRALQSPTRWIRPVRRRTSSHMAGPPLRLFCNARLRSDPRQAHVRQAALRQSTTFAGGHCSTEHGRHEGQGTRSHRGTAWSPQTLRRRCSSHPCPTWHANSHRHVIRNLPIGGWLDSQRNELGSFEVGTTPC